MNFLTLWVILVATFPILTGNEAVAQAAKPKSKVYENWNSAYHSPTPTLNVTPQATPVLTITPDAKILETNEEPSVAAESLRGMQGQAFSIINSLNPAADKNAPPPTDMLSAMNDPNFAATLGRLTELQKLLESPWVRGYLQVITHQDVVTGLGKLANKPKAEMQKLLQYELGALFLYFLLSIWFFGRSMHFLKRFMWKIVFFCGLTCTTSYLLPGYIIGKDYTDFISGLIKAIKAVT